MAHTGIYCPAITDAQYKMGENVSATSKAEAYVNAWCLQSESIINVLCRKVFAADTAAFTALPATTKYILTDASSNLVAIYAISYDMSGFTSRTEAEDMINILRDGFLRDLSVLRDKKMQDFLSSGVEN